MYNEPIENNAIEEVYSLIDRLNLTEDEHALFLPPKKRRNYKPVSEKQSPPGRKINLNSKKQVIFRYLRQGLEVEQIQQETGFFLKEINQYRRELLKGA